MKAPFFRSALLIAVTSLLFSCQKDVSDLTSQSSLDSKAAIAKTATRTIELHGKFVSHTGYDPDESVVGNTWGIPVYAWYPGEGEGTMNHLGKYYTFYNQYAYPIFHQGEMDMINATGVTAPITVAAREIIYNLFNHVEVPDTVGTVMIDKQGNAIFSNGSYKYETIDVTPELVKLSSVHGDFKIVGGTGKFANVVNGRLTIDGFAARTSWNELTKDDFEVHGWIELRVKE